MERNGVEQATGRKPLVLVLEYHSAGAAVMGERVLVARASLYIASGVSVDGVFGTRDMQKPGAAFVQIAERLDKSDAESLANTLADALSRAGVPADVTCIYDE